MPVNHRPVKQTQGCRNYEKENFYSYRTPRRGRDHHYHFKLKFLAPLAYTFLQRFLGVFCANDDKQNAI